MPKLIIDERDIEVPEGTKVIEAAERLGIMIPRFCYHPALGSVGACRVCAVKFLEGPAKGIQMSCMIDAHDDMVVSTTDAEAVDFRRHVIEWLMLNHPHDCPVCDEGGHCLLQDLTVSGGHGLRRYKGQKRTYEDQDLGPLVQHEMNRCIHCYRCARYYQEFSGYKDLGALRIGSRTYFGRFQPGTLQSPFSGNLSDVCPTGVYTDKPARFKGRRWDFERTPSVCRHCSLGCHVTVDARYREIMRHEARYSPDINGYFICDRGRFGFYYTEDDHRPRTAKVDGNESGMDAALAAAQDRLRRVSVAHGPTAIACVTGMGSSLETMYAANRLCRSTDWFGPAYFSHENQAERIRCAVGRLDDKLTISLRQIESADFILAVGADPVNEAPMLAMAMRQAQRKGAGVVVIDPRPIELPLAFTHLAAHPDELDQCFGALLKSSVDPLTLNRLDDAGRSYHQQLPQSGDCRPELSAPITQWAQKLQQARRPVIICGTEIVSTVTPAMAADGCRMLQAANQAAGLFYVLPEANSFGAAMLNGQTFEKVLTRIETGSIKALLIVEWDPLTAFADRGRVQRALDALDLLIVLDHIDSAVAAKAHILLPTATIYESGGLFINQEGRLQQAKAAYKGGISILKTGERSHPPRVYSTDIPGNSPCPAWHWLGQLSPDQSALPSSDYPATVPDFLDELLTSVGLPGRTVVTQQGIRVTATQEAGWCVQPASGEPQASSRDEFIILTTALTFGTERLSAISPPLQQVKAEPQLSMHKEDAESLQVKDGDRVKVQTANGSLSLPVRLCADMARGVLVVPRHHRLVWQILDGDTIRIGKDQISRTQKEQ